MYYLLAARQLNALRATFYSRQTRIHLSCLPLPIACGLAYTLDHFTTVHLFVWNDHTNRSNFTIADATARSIFATLKQCELIVFVFWEDKSNLPSTPENTSSWTGRAYFHRTPHAEKYA